MTISAVKDVTKQPEIRDALSQSEIRYRRLFEAAHDGVLILDSASRKIIDANPFMVHLLGYPREELLGKELWEIGLLKDEHASHAAFRELREKGQVRYEDLPLETKSGDTREVEIVANHYDEGGTEVIQCNIRDITERKRTEEALRASEERYRTLFASAPMAVFVCDRNAVIQHYNRRAAELWGREPVCGTEQHCGSTKLWLPDGTPLPHTQSPIMAVLRTGTPAFNVEVFIERPDGSRVPVLVNFSALRNAHGEITGAITSFVDITERKRTEEVLRASEERFRALFDLGPTAVYSCDASGVIQEFNRRAAELWGRTPAEGDTDERFCGSHKLFRPDGSFMPHDQCPMAEVTSGKISAVHDMEVLIERPDGSRVTVVVNIRSLKNERGDITGAINCFYDITERKQAEETRAKMAAIVESSDDAIIGKTLEGDITSWNHGAERLFGYTAQEAIGQPVTLLIPPDRLQEEPEILARLRQGQHIDHFETVRVRKDGSPLEISLTISPIRDEKDHIIGASKIARDITELKQARERQRLLMAELAHRGGNLLAVVQSIVSRSLTGARSLAEERETLAQRLQALARTRSALTNEGFGAPVAEIIRLEFEAFSDRVTATGPDVTLNTRAAQTFALLVHELATNAAKYGALSLPKGQVDIRWSIEGAGQEARFKFRWQERGGPPVVPPTRQGFGSVLIEKIAAQDFGAESKIRFAPEGVSYEIDAQLLFMTTT